MGVCSLARHNYNIEKRQRKLERKAADAPADPNTDDPADPTQPPEL